MKKLLSILALLLVLTASVSAPVLADEVRGTELQLIVTETPAPTAASASQDHPASPTGSANPATGQSAGSDAAACIILAAALLLMVAAAPKKKPVQ